MLKFRLPLMSSDNPTPHHFETYFTTTLYYGQYFICKLLRFVGRLVGARQVKSLQNKCWGEAREWNIVYEEEAYSLQLADDPLPCALAHVMHYPTSSAGLGNPPRLRESLNLIRLAPDGLQGDSYTRSRECRNLGNPGLESSVFGWPAVSVSFIQEPLAGHAER